jgi:rubredoxin
MAVSDKLTEAKPMATTTDRQCPICGAIEPVAEEALEYAAEQGLPDSWVCHRCWIMKELEFPAPNGVT